MRSRNSLSEEDAASLFDRLISWLVRLVEATEKPLVLRKLCTSLVAYFLRPSVSWDHCIRHLICCFSVGNVVSSQSLSQYPSTAELVSKLNHLQRMTILWFCVCLIEEVGKTNAASAMTYESLDPTYPTYCK